MTSSRLAEWIRGRRPSPPPRLLARLDAMVSRVSDGPPADALMEAAEIAIREVLRGGCLTRESALELLTVDALVTYAFEAAAEEPDALEARTRSALARIAALAEPYPS